MEIIANRPLKKSFLVNRFRFYPSYFYPRLFNILIQYRECVSLIVTLIRKGTLLPL